MDPMISLHSDIDLAEYSPLIRGMALSLCYARDNQGIGLTQSGALNRKFVTWAADAFNWPEYTVNELYVVNKVLNEQDMPPLWPIHALLKHFKLLRRSKGLLKATKAGVSLAERPRDLFDLVAPVYLYRFNHTPYSERTDTLHHFWHVFLNVLNLEAEAGCSLSKLLNVLYGWEETDKYDPDFNDRKYMIRLNVLRPLCWLGLLRHDRNGLGLFEEGTYYKTPLWQASLRLESDPDVGSHRLS